MQQENKSSSQTSRQAGQCAGSVTAIVGANWGDEGKGKITDYLSSRANIVVRFQGGNNAGHTIINQQGKFALRLLPSGVLYPEVINVLGPGVALNIPAFLKERQALIERGIAAPQLRISDRAQVLMPHHIFFDGAEEERLGDRQFGSTRSGIAPFYADKSAKVGIQVSELFDPSRLRGRLEDILVPKNILREHLYGQPALQVEPLLEQLLEQGEAIAPFLCDTTELLREALEQGQQILVEGQLGALRDPDHGIYPCSTSSSTLAGFAAVGAGIPPWAMTRIIAVAKSYSSCVGAGPFVTEIFGDEGEELRRRGGDAGEYGVNTGRPRRMGWFDAVATRYGCRVQGATEVALTLLDVLSYRKEIPVCIAYEVEGKRLAGFPTTAELTKATPVYEMLPGWMSDISGVRSYEDLPLQAREYVCYVEQLIGVPIRSISVGPHRDATIER
jgi:adenylosuccinate synthase